MKRFLYYNQDSINSFLAQIENGLLVKENSTSEKSDSQSATNGIHGDVTGDISAKILGIGAALKGNIHADDSDTEVATTLIRNVQEKALHDYAFERIYNYVIEKKLVNNDNPKIGDVVLIKEVPTFLDFDYFQSLFADNGAVKFSNEQNKKTLNDSIEQIKSSVPKGVQMPPQIKKQIDDLKNSVNNAESERKEMLKTIDAIRNTMPYNRFVMTSNMLIPLDDENFRDNPNIIAFKYGGEISIMGYVTNVVSNEEKQTPNNDFAPLYDTINKVMLTIFKEQDKIYVVHPVALFY